jgi:DNA-binding transcriptional MocR family regulator
MKIDTIQKLRAAIANPELSASAKLIYCALVEASVQPRPRDHGEKELEPGQVAATQKELAEMIGMNVKTVPAALRLLQRKGYILVLSRRKYYWCGFHERVYQVAPEQNPMCDEDSVVRVPRLLRGASKFLEEASELDRDLSKFKIGNTKFGDLQNWLDAVAADYEAHGPRAEAKKSVENFLQNQPRPDFQ